LYQFNNFKNIIAKIFISKKPTLIDRPKTYHDLAIEDMMRILQFDKFPDKVLVVGCGKGIDCELLRQKGAKDITGLDISDRIGQDYPHPNIAYLRASATSIPLGDNSFDLVFSLAALEHFFNPKKAIEEMLRVAKKDHFVYIFTALLWNSPFGHHMRNIFPNDPWIHIRKETPDEVHEYYGKEFCDTQFGHATGFDHIKYMYGDGFNRVSIKEYKEIIASLFSVSSPYLIRFKLNSSHKQLLTPEIKQDLAGYTEEELLTDQLYFVLRKT
jgi:ubiquinone/menaquinone biosynthesis C-methylase UbiE